MLPLIVPLIEESLTGPAKEHFEEDGMVLLVTLLVKLRSWADRSRCTGGKWPSELFPLCRWRMNRDWLGFSPVSSTS